MLSLSTVFSTYPPDPDQPSALNHKALKTKKTPHKVGFVSLGCAKNLVDSEVLMKQMEGNGFRIEFDPSFKHRLDTAIINTCGFINDAKQESIDTIFSFVRAKQENKVDRLFVMGCLSERYKDQLKKELPEVDEFFGVNDLKKILEHLGGEYRKELIGSRKLTTPGHYAYLKIAEGCDRKCSFCAIPSIRGNHLSRSMEEILTEAKILVATGVKELNVISQDTTYYGLDLYKKRMLPDLLDHLAGIGGLEWIRLHYTYPDGFPEHLLDVIKTHPNICSYIDMPLQHISDRILKSMRRGMDSKTTRQLIEKIRNTLPGVSIRTTMIAGYPGETRAEYLELRNFIEESRFERLGVFEYSEEEGTASAKLKDSVPPATKRRRTEELMAIQEQISSALNRNKVGQSLKVVIDRLEDDHYIGRTEFDSPEVDNEVLIPAAEHELITGNFYNVRVTGSDSFDLYATLS